MPSLDAMFRANLARSPWQEAVTYYPARGQSRQIVVTIDAGEMLLSTGPTRIETDEITVAASRLETDPVVGGVENPAIGDSLLRPGDTRKYFFNGEILESTAYSLRFRMKRERVKRAGVEHEQRR